MREHYYLNLLSCATTGQSSVSIDLLYLMAGRGLPVESP